MNFFYLYEFLMYRNNNYNFLLKIKNIIISFSDFYNEINR